MIKTRVCTSCKKEKSLEDCFAREPRCSLGRKHECHDCRSLKSKIYKANSVNREANRLRDAKKRRAKYQELKRKGILKLGANHKVLKTLRNAVSNGKINKPCYCEVCFKRGNPHGHHEDYSKPLDVLWLCRSCHLLVHAYKRLLKKKSAAFEKGREAR